MNIDKQNKKLDRRDEILLFALAICVPLFTLPALLGA